MRRKVLALIFSCIVGVALFPSIALAENVSPVGVTEVSTGEAAPLFADADGHTFDTAAEISVNETVSAAITPGYYWDYYKFTLPSAGPVSLTCYADYQPETGYWAFYLYDETGKYYRISQRFLDDTGEMTFGKVGLPAGTYYVGVRGEGVASIPYQFRVNFEPNAHWETERNNSRADADKIEFGTTYYGCTSTNYPVSDFDFYTFTLDSPKTVKVTMGTDFDGWEGGYLWDFNLLDSKGDRIHKQWLPGPDSTITSEGIDLPAGVYFISCQWTYKLTEEPYFLRVDVEEPPSNYGFSDVIPGDWYATEDILGYVVSNGLLTGYADGSFHPNTAVTRGQVATILWRIAGEPVAVSDSFSDVDYGQFYGSAIRWARAVGVISGYAGNEFRPDVAVSRAELCVMLSNYASEVAGISVASNCSRLDAIAGANEVPSWARSAMGWAVDRGIVSGEIGGDGIARVNPNGSAYRSAVAKMTSVFHRDVLGLG